MIRRMKGKIAVCLAYAWLLAGRSAYADRVDDYIKGEMDQIGEAGTCRGSLRQAIIECAQPRQQSGRIGVPGIRCDY